MPMELILLSYNAFLTVNNAIFLLSKGFQFFKVYLTVQAFFVFSMDNMFKIVITCTFALFNVFYWLSRKIYLVQTVAIFKEKVGMFSRVWSWLGVAKKGRI